MLIARQLHPLVRWRRALLPRPFEPVRLHEAPFAHHPTTGMVPLLRPARHDASGSSAGLDGQRRVRPPGPLPPGRPRAARQEYAGLRSRCSESWNADTTPPRAASGVGAANHQACEKYGGATRDPITWPVQAGVGGVLNPASTEHCGSAAKLQYAQALSAASACWTASSLIHPASRNAASSIVSPGTPGCPGAEPG